jgi:N-acetylmuramoyl-L-alanine amidase
VVLVGTRMPAILAEICCLSNEDEVKLLTNPAYRESIARGLINGVGTYASALNSSIAKGSN